jgi:hypothetical protein
MIEQSHLLDKDNSLATQKEVEHDYNQGKVEKYGHFSVLRNVGSDKPSDYTITPNEARYLEYPEEGFRFPEFIGKYELVAMDCEMVTTTHGDELARVSVVDAELNIVLDEFVLPDH